MKVSSFQSLGRKVIEDLAILCLSKMTFNFDLTRELSGLARRRVGAALDLSRMEEQIYQLEGNYLRDTKSIGNISSGYEAYRGQNKKSNRAVVKGGKKMNQLEENGRIFSNSSVSSRKSKMVGHEKVQLHPITVGTLTSGLKKAVAKSSQAKAPSVKTSMVQGLRGKKVFIRSRSKSQCRFIATSGARRPNLVSLLQKKSPTTDGQVTSLSWMQLRQACLKAGLPAMGKKSDMIARLGWDKA